jgi:hypothetical protein
MNELRDFREVLCRLAVGSASCDPRGRDVLPEYPGCEAAGLLSGMSEEARNIALYRYCMDTSCQPAIFYAALMRVADMASQGHWKLPPPGTDAQGRKTAAEILRKMTAAALFEALEMPKCGRCKGVGHVLALGAGGSGSVTVCHCCDGLGHARPHAAILSHALGRSRVQFYKVWRSRYEMVVIDLSGWISTLESEIGTVLKKQMRTY